jgi:hypothetical protein
MVEKRWSRGEGNATSAIRVLPLSPPLDKPPLEPTWMDVLDCNHVASMQGVGGGNLASKHPGGGSADPPTDRWDLPLVLGPLLASISEIWMAERHN